jgi:hypothetical protein
MKPYSKCSRCERSEPCIVRGGMMHLPPDGWGEVYLQVTGRSEYAREFVFCDRCRPDVVLQIDRLALGNE